MTAEERLVYQLIEKAGNKGESYLYRTLALDPLPFNIIPSLPLLAGIWIRDLRQQSNLDMKLIGKILKTMESKKLIKAVTSVVVRAAVSIAFSRRSLTSAL